MIEITQFELFHMLVSSLRYAYGRKTYIVSDTCEWIRKYYGRLTSSQQSIIFRDLKRCLENLDYGHDCDLKEWVTLLEDLKNYGVK